MKRSPILILTSSLICFSFLRADGVADLEQDLVQNAPIEKMPSSEPNISSSQKSCKLANNPYRIDIKHVEGKGVGYNQGYTSLDAFFTSLFWERYIPFFDVRAHVFNNGKWAANAGLGARYIFDPCHWMVGGNVYYDYRATKHGHYNQISVGLEAFYDRYEAHLNGYLPVGQKRHLTKQQIESVTFKGFSGNYILQNENYKNSNEGAMKGFNTELGMHLAGNRIQYDLYFGVGPYYYDVSSGKHAWGGKARLKAELAKYLFLELSNSYDRIFHNRVQGTVNLNFPFGSKICYEQKSERSCPNVMDWQAVLPVERQEIIVVSKFKKDKTIDPVAIDPATGHPFFVVFVNNTNPSLGNGTFESPFQNLTNNDNVVSAENFATDGNIIYVFAGDGSSTHMAGGNMFLSDHQRLLGSANSHPFQTTKGLLTIPQLTTLIPHVQGPATASIINLANYNEISGFDISFPQFAFVSTNDLACINGITVASPLIDTNINHNNLVNQKYGLALGNFFLPNVATGNLIITDNTSSGHTSSGGGGAPQGFSFIVIGSQNAQITFENNYVHDDQNGATGLFIRSYGNDVVSLQNNRFENEANSGFVCSIEDMEIAPDLFTIKGNTINNTPRSFAVNITQADSRATVVMEENGCLNSSIQSFIRCNTAGAIGCVRFNNNKGHPYQGGGNPFLLEAVAGTLFVESPQNNYPQPAQVATTLQPACFCAPCN